MRLIIHGSVLALAQAPSEHMSTCPTPFMTILNRYNKCHHTIIYFYTYIHTDHM